MIGQGEEVIENYRGIEIVVVVWEGVGDEVLMK